MHRSAVCPGFSMECRRGGFQAPCALVVEPRQLGWGPLEAELSCGRASPQGSPAWGGLDRPAHHPLLVHKLAHNCTPQTFPKGSRSLGETRRKEPGSRAPGAHGAPQVPKLLPTLSPSPSPSTSPGTRDQWLEPLFPCASVRLSASWRPRQGPCTQRPL